MIKIKFLCNWCSSETLLKDICLFFDWEEDNMYLKKYSFTSQNDFTHIIFINWCNFRNKIKKDNIIGLAWEPYQLLNFKNIDRFSNLIKKYYIGNNKNLTSKNIVQNYSYMLPLIPYTDVNNFIKKYPEKNKLINYVYSDKNLNPNMLYSYRKILGESIIKNNLNVNIYGGITDTLRKKYPSNENIKTKFDWNKVSDVYKDYKFSIVLENSIHPSYFSEKIIIPLLCGCVPIYLGCTEINKYFGDYVIHLTGNLEEDLKIIEMIIKEPEKYYKRIDIKKIKEKIHMKNLIHEEFL